MNEGRLVDPSIPMFRRILDERSASALISEGIIMKPRSRIVGIASTLLVVLAGLGIWNAALRVPSIDRLALPVDLIAADSAAGKALLEEKNFIADYDALSRNFESQSRPAFCGVASSVVVLNALHGSQPRLTQSTFFTDAASRIRSQLQTTFGGMSLAELSELLRAHGVEVTTHYAADTDLNAFRSIARQNLETVGDFLMVNYERAALGQKEGGHISPVAAYNAATDRMLILDVAAHKYPPVWVSTAALWNAMNTLDRTSRRTRGFVVVRR